VFSLPFGQCIKHTRLWRMHWGGRSGAPRVKTLAVSEWRMKNGFSKGSVSIGYDAWIMSDVSAHKDASARVTGLVRKAACRSQVRSTFAAVALGMACLAVSVAGPAQARAHAQPSHIAPLTGATPAVAASRRLAQEDRAAQVSPDALQGMVVPRLRASRACKRPREMRRRLKRQGWWDFRGLRRAGGDFVVRARRPNGAAYQLKIDGCSGRVLGAIRMNGERRGYRVWPR